MRHHTVNTEVLKDPSWWHWAVTVPLLAADLSGVPTAIPGAIVLSLVMSCYYCFQIRAIKPFPVQLRLAYAAWLLCGLLPGLRWMHWIALLGTTAMVTVGYCPLARTLKLFPFNRTEPLTVGLVWRSFITDPCAGGLVGWSRSSESSAAAPCSMLSQADCSARATNSREKGERYVQTS